MPFSCAARLQAFKRSGEAIKLQPIAYRCSTLPFSLPYILYVGNTMGIRLQVVEALLVEMMAVAFGIQRLQKAP